MHIALMTTAMVLWAVAALAQAESRPATAERPAAATTAEPEARPANEAGSAGEAKPAPPPLAEFTSLTDTLPRLRYLADGLVTLNDRCPVRKVKLNPRMQAAYVNGFPVGFC
ncbi:MAG: hypothetical protein IPO18_07545 [bacterium]|nr:hypothetical protein [bacterium]